MINYFIDKFIKKCKVLSDPDKISNNADIVKNANETLTEDLIKKKLRTNKIFLPFKSPKLKLW